MKTDPLSAQVTIETCTWDVPPERLKTGNTVDYVVSEPKWVKARLHQAEAPKWT